MGALLLGLVGVACGNEDPIVGCESTQDCIDQGNSCPSGQELFCNYGLGGVCDCIGGTGGSGGAGGTGGAESCVLGQECNPFEIYDCDTPCQSFCGSSGTEAYGTCVGVPNPSMPPYYCVCHCTTEECP